MIYDGIFYFVAGLTTLFALCTVLTRNIFHGAIALALTLLSVAGVYFYLQAEFLAIAQVLVYVGAIIILFVFAIMLTAKIEDATIRQTNQQVVVSAIAALGFLALLVVGILSYPWPGSSGNLSALTLQQLGTSLLTVYALPFEFISVILLAALVGAIVIAKVKKL